MCAHFLREIVPEELSDKLEVLLTHLDEGGDRGRDRAGCFITAQPLTLEVQPAEESLEVLQTAVNHLQHPTDIHFTDELQDSNL